MLLSTPQDFCEIDLRSAGLILPAPEISRSMTNFGMIISVLLLGSPERVVSRGSGAASTGSLGVHAPRQAQCRAMNYQHIYHAGNFADVAKHVGLLYCLGALQRKDAALFVLDSHAGRGFYDLQAPEAVKSGEA